MEENEADIEDYNISQQKVSSAWTAKFHYKRSKSHHFSILILLTRYDVYFLVFGFQA